MAAEPTKKKTKKAAKSAAKTEAEKPAADADAPQAEADAAQAEAAEVTEAAESESATETPPSPEEKIKELEEKYLRAEAENQNIRRRAQEQIAAARLAALKSFVPALGEVNDCLEKALAADGGGGQMREGVSLTLRKLKAAMELHHISPIRPDTGAQFDPNIHSAIGMAPPTGDAPAGTVAAVIQPGYMIDGRVVRAADVMVAQAAPQADAQKTEQE